MIYFLYQNRKRKEGDGIEKIKNLLKKQDIFLIIFALISFVYGLSLDFSVFLVTIIFLIEILIMYLKNKKLNLKLNNAIIVSSILLFFVFLSTFWAIDKTDSQIGILRFLSLVIFNILLMQIKDDRKEKILNIVSYSALMMLVTSIIMWIIPFTRNIVISNSGRLTGFFDYANSFALFLLIGLVINTEKKNDKFAIIMNILFIIGILLTGSRTTLILTLIYLIYSLLFKKKEHKKRDIIIYSSFAIISIIVLLILKNSENIGRIFSVSFSSGTFLERIIYWKDGLKLLKLNLFGYGYMGYFYKIFEVQTAMYTTKFIHNEYLQMALDIGIIPTIIFIGFLFKMLFSKENPAKNKIILLIIMLHMFMDFDLQFMIIFYIIFLCFDNKTYKETKAEINITFIVTIVLGIVLYGYWFIPTFTNHIQEPEISNNILKNYTESKIVVLSNLDDIDKAYKMAIEIEENNKYVQIVYNIKAMYYMQKGDIDKAVQNRKRQIELNKYDKSNYEEYVLMLSKMLDNYVKKEDNTSVSKCINYIIEVEDMVKDANSTMDKLEYKIRKNPEIELSEEIQSYIQKMKEIKMEGIK